MNMLTCKYCKYFEVNEDATWKGICTLLPAATLQELFNQLGLEPRPAFTRADAGCSMGVPKNE